MKISKIKIEKIQEQILGVLYHNSPKPMFTAHIAREIARDEEFIKKLLIDLKNKKIIIPIRKNPKGADYLKRFRWKLSKQTYDYYKTI